MWKAIFETDKVYVQALCSTFIHSQGEIYDRYYDSISIFRPVLLSLVGSAQACKAIASAVSLNKTIQIEPTTGNETPIKFQKGHSKGFSREFRHLLTTLKNNIHHLVMADKRIFTPHNQEMDNLPKTLIAVGYIGQSDADAVFAVLKKWFSTPMLPQWSDYILQELKKREFAQKLRGTYPGPAYELNLSVNALDSLVSEGIKTKMLDF